MLQLNLEADRYEYEIRGLAMSFYPGITIARQAAEAAAAQASGQDTQQTAASDNQQADSPQDLVMTSILTERGLILQLAQTDGSFNQTETVEGPFAEGIDEKNAVICAVYRLFSAHTGRSLVWGTLTGVRPTKLAYRLLDAGMSEEEAAEEMQRVHYLSAEKAALGTRVAAAERRLLSKLDYDRGYSVYIGIPFCPTRCLYCSFTSYPVKAWAKKVDLYLDQLIYEIQTMAGKMQAKGLHLDTIYIGGGTPTSIEADQLDRLLSAITQAFDLSRCLEFTVEGGRPDSITREKLQVLRRYPVTRISINPQTMKDETLKLIGRQHSVEQVREAFTMAREEGFDNINMDIILGLPEETAEDVAYTLQEIEKLHPDSLTVHTLALKRASRLNTEAEYSHYRYNRGQSEEMMALAAASADRMGLAPYYLYRQKNMTDNLENVGYAEPGKEGIYNILMMEEKQSIVACGAGTVSKRVYPDGHIERCDTVKDVALYVEKIEEMISRKDSLFA